MEEKKLQTLIADFKDKSADSTVELEIRLKSVTRDIFEALITALPTALPATLPNASARVQKTVNIIAHNVLGAKDESASIWQIDYDSGTPVSTYMRKSRIRSVFVSGYLNYNIGIAYESTIEKFPTPTDALVRFKLRYTVDLDAKWRIDVTAVRSGTLQSFQNELKMIKKELFPDDISPENFLKRLNHEFVSQYEVEIEYIGHPDAIEIEDFKVLERVFALINSEYTAELQYQEEIYNIAREISPTPEKFRSVNARFKQLSNQVVSLSVSSYSEIYPPVSYYITEKADGKRVIASIRGMTMYVVSSDALLAYSIGDFSSDFKVIADCELVGDTLYVFDVMYLGENISQKPFRERIEYINRAVEVMRKYKPDVTAKNYVQCSENLQHSFESVLQRESPFQTDGIIITSPNDAYYATSNYKWKPYAQNTIDFLAMKCPDKLLGTLPYAQRAGSTLYLLFVGIDKSMQDKLGLGLISHYRSIFPHSSSDYYPIQFSPSCNPLAYLYWTQLDIHGKIVELGRDDANREWVFHRTREDRNLEKNYYGNDYRIAELTYMNYIDRFDPALLWTPPTSYFTKTADGIYTAPNRYKRFVISVLLKDHLSKAKYCIDLAAGRGADLHRYKEIGVSNALFIDVDKTAIAELIRRKFNIFNKRRNTKWIGGSVCSAVHPRITSRSGGNEKLFVKDSPNMTVNTLVADLKLPYTTLIEMTSPFGIDASTVDGIVCNFAIHYFCDTLNNIRNLLQFVGKMLRDGGIFIFTVFDGARIYKNLSGLAKGETWQLYENDVLKYAIRKEYSGAFAKTGQTIMVKLPFADEMYSEPLCNLDMVTREAAKYSLQLEQCESMTSYKAKFYNADRALSEQLTPVDLEYIDLHSFVTMRKVKK
jgi:SAM-dependent methyltransferase